jgi:hypothetical protein
MLKNNLVEAFYTAQAFKWDPDKGFRLASGLTSPYYVDCRALMAQPSARRGPRVAEAQPSADQLHWGARDRGDLDCHDDFRLCLYGYAQAGMENLCRPQAAQRSWVGEVD